MSLSLSSRQHLHSAVQHTGSCCTLMAFPELLAEAMDHQFKKPFLVNVPILSYNSLMWNTMFPDLKKKLQINHYFFLFWFFAWKNGRPQTTFTLFYHFTITYHYFFSFNNSISKFSPAIPKTLSLSRFFLAWSNMFKSNSWTQKALDALKPNMATTPPSIIYTNIFPLT